MKSLLALSLLSTFVLSNTVNLKGSYESALQHNTNLKIYQKNISIEKENVNVAKSPMRPSINLTLSQNKYFKSFSTQRAYQNAPKQNDITSAELQITQRVYDNDVDGEYKKSKITHKKTVLEYEAFKQELLINVAESYLQVLFLEESLVVAQKKLETLEKQKADIKRRFDLGDATVQDLTFTQSKYQVAQFEKIEVISNLNISKEKFKALTGISLANTLKLENIDNLNNLMLIDSIDSFIDSAKTNNINIKIKQYDLLLTKETLQTNKNDYIPKVNLIGSSNFYRTDKSISSSEKYHSVNNYVGVQLVAPLYEGGIKQTKIRQAKEQINIANLELDYALEELRFNIVSEYMNIKKLEKQLESLKVGLQSAQTSVDAAKVGFNVGSRTHFEVLEAIEEYYSIKSSISDVKYQYTLSQLRLKKFSGILSDKDINL